MLAFLLDENTNPNLLAAIRRRSRVGGVSVVDVLRVGEPDAPKRGTLDPDLLVWCEENGRVLVSNDRNSLPTHFNDHLAEGRHSPGILLITRRAKLRELVESLVLIAEAEAEFCYDQWWYIPL